MTKTQTDGGPAFPPHDLSRYGMGPPENGNGMSLRDYFAGQALANPTICTGTATDHQLVKWFGERVGVTSAEIISAQAHDAADAMIAARETDNG